MEQNWTFATWLKMHKFQESILVEVKVEFVL